jgi:hypothetical protein
MASAFCADADYAPKEGVGGLPGILPVGEDFQHGGAGGGNPSPDWGLDPEEA